MLDRRIIQPIEAEPARSAQPRRLPAPGTQDPLAQLVQEEWASYQAHERTFLANATALSHSILAILGYPAEAQEIRHEDLAVFMGKNLGDLLQGLGEEFSLRSESERVLQ